MGRSSTIKTLALGLLTSSVISSSAIAGGFDRGGVNIDLLFDERRLAADASVTFVIPNRDLRDIRRTVNATAGLLGAGAPPPASQGSLSPENDYVVPRFGVKTTVANNFDCLASYSEPYGADQTNGAFNALSASSVEFFIDTQDYGLTCSYQMGAGTTSVGDSFFRIIGGVSYQELQGFLSRQSFLDFSNAGIPALLGPGPFGTTFTVGNTAGLGTFDVDGSAVGWRAGVAYEIPDIALRAVLLYHSAYEYDLSGIQDNTGFGVAPGSPNATANITATTEIPQALELKLQSGIAPGTLAFANFKWQEWSEIDIVPIVGGVTATNVAGPNAIPTSLAFEAGYQDGYTISAGIGKQFSDTTSGLISFGWDRQTSTVSGTQTDTWTMSGGINYKSSENVDIRLGGLVGILEGGTSTALPNSIDAANAVTYSFDADLLLAATASIKVGF